MVYIPFSILLFVNKSPYYLSYFWRQELKFKCWGEQHFEIVSVAVACIHFLGSKDKRKEKIGVFLTPSLSPGCELLDSRPYVVFISSLIPSPLENFWHIALRWERWKLTRKERRKEGRKEGKLSSQQNNQKINVVITPKDITYNTFYNNP
jgi:hypothetical protein